MIEKIKIKYNILNGSGYEESKFSSNQDGLSHISPLDLDAQSNISSNQDEQSNISSNQDVQNLQKSLIEIFKIKSINDALKSSINDKFESKSFNDNNLVFNYFLEYNKFDQSEITNMIYLLIDDINYENLFLNDFNNKRKIECLFDYSRQNFIPNRITEVFITHFYNNMTNYCNLININKQDIEKFQKYYEYIDIENKYCIMLFDKLPLPHKSNDNNQEMILETKEEMLNELLMEQLNEMVKKLLEKKNFLMYIYILHKYFEKDEIQYKSITDYYFTDYTYEDEEENLTTNNGFNNLLNQMIYNELFLETVELIKTLVDNYLKQSIKLIRKTDNYNKYKRDIENEFKEIIEDEFNTINNTSNNLDDLSVQKKKYNTIVNEKIGILKKYNIFFEDDIDDTINSINEIIHHFYYNYIIPSRNKTLIDEYQDNFVLLI